MSERSDYTVIITRSEKQSSSFSQALQKLGFGFLIYPSIEIKTIAPDQKNAETLRFLQEGRFDWLVFTSANAITSLKELIPGLFLPEKTKIAVVGEKTAKILKENFKREADLMPEKFVAESLIEEFESQGFGDTSGAAPRVLLVLASKTRNVISPYFVSKGALVSEIAVYENIQVPPSDDIKEKILSLDPGKLIFTFFSPSAVNSVYANFTECREMLLRANVASIGPITTKALSDKGITVHYESNNHSEEGLLEVLRLKYS